MDQVCSAIAFAAAPVGHTPASPGTPTNFDACQAPKTIVEASINVIGVLDNVSQAIGQPLDEVRQLQDDSLRWDAEADEARAFLNGIEGANLIRRQRLALIATQAYTIGTQLARDPDNAVLVPHVEEVKRLKGVSRRKKTTQAPQTPAPAPPATAHGTENVM
jgi:hypothetical protein